ncbi:hypothetical protein HpBT350_12630 [Helicobacter pylori]
MHLAYEKAIKEDLSKFKRYQKELHSLKLDLMQKGFDDFSDARFNKIESLKKEFSEQERSKRENLEKLNQVINLFKKSIDKVFDRVSAFTWEKYKEENDDEENNTKKRTTMKKTMMKKTMMKKTTRSLNRSRKKQTAESESLKRSKK